MIIPDLNLLVFAHNEASPFHEQAKRWWAAQIDAEVSIGLAWMVTFGFIRLLTSTRVMRQPVALQKAIAIPQRWLEQDPVRPLDPGPRHFAIATQLFREASVGANMTTDIHLAALAIENQAELHSNDGDFARFSGLKWHNPLRE